MVLLHCFHLWVLHLHQVNSVSWFVRKDSSPYFVDIVFFWRPKRVSFQYMEIKAHTWRISSMLVCSLCSTRNTSQWLISHFLTLRSLERHPGFEWCWRLITKKVRFIAAPQVPLSIPLLIVISLIDEKVLKLAGQIIRRCNVKRLGNCNFISLRLNCNCTSQ